jgi:hypothetical protein
LLELQGRSWFSILHDTMPVSSVYDPAIAGITSALFCPRAAINAALEAARQAAKASDKLENFNFPVTLDFVATARNDERNKMKIH